MKTGSSINSSEYTEVSSTPSHRFHVLRFLTSLCFLLCFLLAPAGARKAEAAVLASGSCGDNVMYTISDDGAARVYVSGSGYGVMDNYESGSSPFYSYRGTITKIEIESGVTRIGENAFVMCTSVTQITLAEGLDEIGRSALGGTRMTGITLPESLRVIDDFAFQGCTELQSLRIPSKVYAVRGQAFSQCDSLTAFTVSTSNAYFSAQGGVLFNSDKSRLVKYPAGKAGAYVIPDSVQEIAYYAFEWAKNLTSVTIPDNGLSMAPNAFEDCTGLVSVNLPGSLTSIEFGVFFNCTSLKEVKIGSGIQYIGGRAFDRCNSLTHIEIPDTVTSIGFAAFRECTYLESILIPPSVTEFGDEIFRGCVTWLTIYGTAGSAAQTYAQSNGINFKAVNGQCGENVYWSMDTDGNVDIFGSGPMYDYADSTSGTGASPFRANTAIKKVNVREGVTSVGNYAFYGCSGITGNFQPDLPNSLTRIGAYAFRNCTAMTHLNVPASVTSIGQQAFAGCSALEDAYFAGTKETVMTFGTNIYEKTSKLVVYARLGTTAISDAKNRGIKYYLVDPFEWADFTIPYKVKVIEQEAFAGIAAQHVWLGEQVTAIKSRAFAGSTTLTKIRIPAGCTSIAADAFDGCRSDLMIYGDEGTTAEAFAKAHGFYFALGPAG